MTIHAPVADLTDDEIGTLVTLITDAAEALAENLRTADSFLCSSLDKSRAHHAGLLATSRVRDYIDTLYLDMIAPAVEVDEAPIEDGPDDD